MSRRNTDAITIHSILDWTGIATVTGESVRAFGLLQMAPATDV